MQKCLRGIIETERKREREFESFSVEIKMLKDMQVDTRRKLVYCL